MQTWQMQIRLHKAVWRESYLWHLLFPDSNLDEQILEWRIGALHRQYQQIKEHLSVGWCVPHFLSNQTH